MTKTGQIDISEDPTTDSNGGGVVNTGFKWSSGDRLEAVGNEIKVFPEVKENGQEAKAEHQKAGEEEERQQWGHPIEFLLSCISMSVGLGNVWRFPTTAFNNGGGAFLIPYIIVLIFIGRPLYFLELAIGQFSSCSCAKVWKMVPAVKGVGYGQIIATWAVVTYYCALMALTVFYFVMSFNKVLPWSVCDEAWADENCVDASGTNFTYSNNSQSSSEQFYYNYVLKIKEDISDGVGLPDWRLTLCLLFSWLMLFLTLAWGVKSSGKVAYFTALFPYVVLFTLLGRGATLPGAVDGMLYFITPRWHKLLDPNVWFAAVSQSFFSLSVGFGPLFNFASYNKFSQNVYRDGWIISLTDTITSLLAGFTIFAILGNLAHLLDTSIEDVVRGSGGLAFISYPDAIAKFNWAPQLFAVLFFLMLFTLGVGSAAGLAGCVMGGLMDQFPSIKRVYVAAFICALGFLCGLVYVTPGGQQILELVDFFGGSFIIFFLVIIEVTSIMYIYGCKNLFRDMRFMLGFDIDLLTKVCWVAVTPLLLIVIFVYTIIVFQVPTYNGAPFPDLAYVCGWILTCVAVGAVPIGFLHALYRSPETTFAKRLRGLFGPKESWGPKRLNDRLQWEKLIRT
ncbi:sodium-dependent nutrient amino acid transporter 1-like [Eriocheir sinensis]|uniref:sodium-dependent nutrient amino acid transporter 1-like n=1 Tax=Eriocheir sinensis TaxID=95602 RepID=UPI0021CABE18|nr:sodium-dependent nutrient amino acid transporter 1-like [Eriocheir sinensis]